MITLFYQTDIDIPNSIPCHLRSNKIQDYKSVYANSLVNICNYLNIPIRQITKNQYQGESAYYHIELAWLNYALGSQNVFYNIDNDILEIIKDNNSNLKLLLWYPVEGFSLTLDNFIKKINFYINNLNIPPRKVYFVFGDNNVKENYKSYQNKLNLSNINVFGCDIFEIYYNINYCTILKKNKNSFLTKKHQKQNINRYRSKRFIFKNANPRNHRLFFAAELNRRNLLSKSYFSWLNRYSPPNSNTFKDIINFYSFDQKNIINNINSLNKFMTNAPYIIDYNAKNIFKGLNQNILIPMHFADSYFSFVTETIFDNSQLENILFITEKVYQPIVQYHPFILAAAPGTLAFMKQNNYETFPELFNEAYDDIECFKNRAKLILQNIENVANMPIEKLNEIYYDKSFQKKLINNKNKFLSCKGKHKLEKVLNWLDN